MPLPPPLLLQRPTPIASERTSTRRALAVLATLAIVFGAPEARAQKAPPKKPAAPPKVEEPSPNDIAQELKLKGDAAFDAREFDEAAKAYEEAYEASKDPALLYNQGRAYQSMTRFPEALERIERFQAEASPALRARVPRLDELLAQLRAKVAVLDVRASVPSARVVVDTRVVGDVAGTGTFRVNAGRARVEITSDGYLPFTKDVDLAAGATTVVEAKLVSRKEGGILVVKSNTSGAAVAIDGKPSGQTPAELVLLAGPHSVTLSREGFRSVTASSVVDAGQTKELYVPLDKSAPIFEKWWFWTAAGAVVVVAGIVVVALVTEKGTPSGSIPPGQTSAPLISF
ncbi:MAG: PEGA domain-containing protein [Labilithrix sp.]|nr:PEGA domain-containing protein [Labilithrix sp.]MCW5816000.1 PEGA domain-containing protein [Labilithrix sp.]